MSDYDVIIDDVTKTCFIFLKFYSESYVMGKIHSESYVIGKALT